jgi:hypothetical protein
VCKSGRRARATTDFRIPDKEIQIFRNEIQAGRNKIQIQRNKIQMKSFDFLRRIGHYQGLAPTPKAIFSFWAASVLNGAIAA